MKKQPELPDFVRDMEIVQSLNRTLGSLKDSDSHPDVEHVQDGTDRSSS